MISLLIKLPWIAKALGFFKNKTRLAIEYFLIAVLITVAGATFTMWLSKERTEKSLQVTKTELVTVQDRLVNVERINRDQQETIAELRSLRSKDAEALTGLLYDYKELSKNDTHARQRLTALEDSNDFVKTYLNQRIPSDLACLLNNSCQTRNSGSDKDRKSSPAK